MTGKQPVPSQVIYNAIFATKCDRAQLQDGHVFRLFRATILNTHQLRMRGIGLYI